MSRGVIISRREIFGEEEEKITSTNRGMKGEYSIKKNISLAGSGTK